MTVSERAARAKADLMIRSIEIKNYRQYYGSIKIEFSTNPKKPLTIVQGANGAGKSNIMNAISWCLYLEEPHLKKESEGLPIINTEVFGETPMNKNMEMEVKIVIGNSEEALYDISRALQIYKKNDSTEIKATKYGPLPNGVGNPTIVQNFMKRGSKGWIQLGDFNAAANQILPCGLSSFFFFDGEELTRFFSKDISSVKKGIEVVSQITLTDSAIEHLRNMTLEYMKQTKGHSSEADIYLQEIKQKEESRNQKNKKLDEKEKELAPTERRIKEIEMELRKNTKERVREYQKDRDKFKKIIHDQDTNLDEIKEKRLSSIFAFGPKIYLEDCISYILKEIDAQRKENNLPPPINRVLCDELLHSNKCICGREIPESGPIRVNIEKQLAKAELAGVSDFAAEGRLTLKMMINNFKNDISNLNKYRTDIKEIEESRQEYQERLNEISARLQDIDEEGIEELERELRAKKDSEKELQREIWALGADIKSIDNRINKLNRLHDNEVSKYRRLQMYQQRIHLCKTAKDILVDFRRELLAEVREKVESKTREYFFGLIWKKEAFNNVTIDDDYKISVIHKDGYNAVGSLSAGETLYLALSFIFALRDIAGFKFPLVIDTPLGRVSGKPKINAAKNIPNYLPGTQITLLVTDTEYASPVVDENGSSIGSFRDEIHDSVGKEYKLLNNVERAEVVPY